MKILIFLLLLSLPSVGAEEVDLGSFIGRYRGVGFKGDEVDVEIRKGMRKAIFAKDLVIVIAYPNGVHEQTFVDFGGAVPVSDGKGGAIQIRPRLEGATRLVLEYFKLRFFWGKTREVLIGVKTYEVIGSGRDKVLHLTESVPGRFTKRLHPRHSCHFMLAQR